MPSCATAAGFRPRRARSISVAWHSRFLAGGERRGNLTAMGGGHVGLVVLFGVVTSSCASQSAPKLVGQPIKKEVALLVRVSDAAAETDDLGGTAGLVDGVTESLGELRVENQVFAADDDHPPAPRIELWVERWDAGDRKERTGATLATEGIGTAGAVVPGLGVVGALFTAGGYSVLCKVYTKDGARPARVHRYSGMLIDSDPEVSARLGERVGRAIVADAFD